MAEQSSSEQSIFLAAAEKPSAAERRAYLDQVCAGNAALRGQVEALLAAHERLPAGGAATAELALDPPLMFTAPGTVIGRYKLLEPIGEGGYGTVFMAEQTSPVQRKVALKVIKAGMDTRQVIARFEAERQALALMDHPNIAKVFDAGVTDTGRPYFVMELVRGTPITKYCDEHRIEPRQRLELFMQICQAVQHAHQKGIIHRDLKPSNVLIAQYDGKPVPKVIDFGVAKATGQKLTERTMFTGFGDVIGTLEYMSPEQAEVNQLDVDTRSDIYSLGVLLYELLTGSTPLERKRVMNAGLLEMLRVVREEEPPKPSTRLSTSEGLPGIAANRGLEPKKLSGLVHGELDWIVMKALEKDRNRRYETANGLASDVRRYLNDEAVQACPPSVWYRFRKFARRNKAPIAAATAAMVVLVTAVVGLSVSNILIGRALSSEQRALGQAQTSATEAAANLVQARQSERSMRQAVYAARINLAQGAADPADIDRMLELLNGLRPEPGQEDLRGFEWYYLWRLCHNERLTLQEFSSPVRRAVFSPDGKTLATGHGAEVKLFSVSGELLTTLPAAKHQIRSLAFSPDGALLAVGGGAPRGTGEVQVWDCASKSRRLTLPEQDEPVSAVAFSPDGKTLATATAAFVVSSYTAGDRTVAVKRGPRADRVRLWNLDSGKALGSFEGPTENLLSMAFSPDGKFLVGGEETWNVIVWETTTFRKQTSVKSETWHVGAVSFSPDGKLLATGCAEWDRPGKMVLYSFPSMQPVKVLSGFNGGITSLAFSPDGKVIAAGSHDRRIYLYSTGGTELGRFLGHRDFVASVAFSPDGRKLVSSSWDNTVRIWDADKSLRDVRRLKAGLSCAFLTDGQFVTHYNSLSVIDRATSAIQHPQEEFASVILNVAVSPDGRLIATGDVHGHVMVWDSSTLARLHDFQDSEKQVWSVKFSPNGHTLASAGDNNKVTLRNVSDGRIIRVLEPQGERARCVAFAPDGLHLAIATWQGNAAVQVWDLVSGQASPPLEGRGATSVKYSPDGKLLAVARQNLTWLYDAHTGRTLDTITGHSGDVFEIAFSLDGKTLASISYDRTVRLWSISNQQLLLTFTLDSPGRGVAFSRDGRTLGAASWTAHFWDAADPVEADEHIDGVLHRIDALRRAGQIADSEQFAAGMLAQYRQRWGEHHAWTARLMVERASLLIQLGDASKYPEAETLVVNSRAELGKKLVPGHEWRWRALYVARDLYGPGAMNDSGKLAEILAAIGYSPTSSSTTTAATMPAKPTAASIDELNRKAYLLRRDGHLEEARALRQQVVERAAALYSKTDPRLAKIQGDYISLLIEMKRYQEAEPLAREAFEALPPADTTSRQLMLRLLVRLYEQWPKPEEAERYRKLVNSAEAATRPATSRAIDVGGASQSR